MDPETIARRLAAELDINAIDIGIPLDGSADTVGAVGVPVWLWVQNPRPATVGPLRARDTELGVTVSVAATLDAVHWDMGDGTTVRCSGRNARGTVYVPSDEMVDSPTCGHRYQKQGAPYTITATSHWTVTWSGGGLSGTIPITVSTAVQRNIGELQALTVPNP